MNKCNNEMEAREAIETRDTRDTRDTINIKHIMTQTNYSEEEAKSKLQEFSNDFMMVLKDYMGIPIQKQTNGVKSVNQEIYKQIRYNLDQTMKDYREKNPVNLEQIITNLQESDEREKDKEKEK